MRSMTDRRLHHIASWTPQLQTLTPAKRVGRIAENLVIYYLKTRGWAVISRNYETSRGEVDIIASKMHEDLRGYPTVAFIEVKSRSTNSGLPPEMNVTSSKRQKFTSTVRQWIGSHARLKAVYRCDIAALIVTRKKMPRIRYFKNAFYIRESFGW